MIKIRTGGVVKHAHVVHPMVVGEQLLLRAAPVDETADVRLVNTSLIQTSELEWEEGDVYSTLLHTETGSTYRLVQRGLRV